MPNSVKKLKFSLLLCLCLWPLPSLADEFAAKVRFAELIERAEDYKVNAEIDYQLTPTAKEALHKGVPLAWDVLIKIRQPGFLRTTTIFKRKLPYSLQFHALLNQYAVKGPSGQAEMFLTLNAALNFMSVLHDAAHIDKQLLEPGNQYQLAVRTRFNRELLPVPLRPVAYLDAQWFLSSDWFIWPIQK